jgi:hypothetical protein
VRSRITNSVLGRGRGIGQFAGNADPQAPGDVLSDQLHSSMSGDPGLRLAKQMAARGSRFGAGGLVPQRYIRLLGGSNDASSLEVLQGAVPIKHNRSRALGQFRGTPTMSLPPAPAGDEEEDFDA